jgi:hypothetical protein
MEGAGLPYETIRHLYLRRLFADDAQRGVRLTAEAVGLYLDYSKIASPTRRSGCSCRSASNPAFEKASTRWLRCAGVRLPRVYRGVRHRG